VICEPFLGGAKELPDQGGIPWRHALVLRHIGRISVIAELEGEGARSRRVASAQLDLSLALLAAEKPDDHAARLGPQHHPGHDLG
jgi:hypothetical protein